MTEQPIVEQPVDIAVVGGGLSGATAALALSRARPDATLALVDPAPPSKVGQVTAGPIKASQAKAPKDIRATALSYTSANFLRYLGLWSDLSTCCPIENIHVSQRGGFGVAKLAAAEHDLSALGYVAENDELLRALQNAIAARPNIQRIEESVTAVEQGEQGAELLLDQQRIRPKLIVAADGAHSSIASAVGLESQTNDFQQLALVANIAVKPRKPNLQFTAWERFTRQGPVALLPLGEHDAGLLWFNLVWCQSTEACQRDKERLLAESDQALLQRFQTVFGERAGQFQAIVHRQVFPLHYSALAAVSKANIAFVGNAAQALHPVAGQGFNLGLRDIATLAELLEQRGLDGGERLLSEYAQRREQDRRMSIQFTNGIVQLFSAELAPVGMARGLGLGLIGANARLRQAVAKHNMGHRGYLPANMLGGRYEL